MRGVLRLLLLVAGLLAVSPAFAQTAGAATTPTLDAARCEALAGGRFQGLKDAPTWIEKAAVIPATAKRQALCSVTGYVNPTDNFALYMPIGHWNGRYIVRGCGGSCGVIAMELVCGLHARDGFACLVTDMGHTSSIIDNNWVANNLQGLVEFGYRATHVTAIAGKAILASFYGRAAQRSYFYGCSTGGRQALIEAQRFPDDFDGIVAVAPASLAPFGSKQAASISDIDRFNLGQGGRPILPNRKAVLIHQAVVRACDRNDGRMDGLIGDPTRCSWEPEAIACQGADTRDCLTPAQIAVVHKLYEWRGALKGSELNWIGNYIRNAPLPGETWQPLDDLAVGRGEPATIDSMVEPNNPDLRPFRDRGGRLILVQGWADHSVLPPPTIDYYQTVEKTMDGPDATRRFARLFMIPGMDHCSGGEGASAIDYVGPITSWVEDGTAPDALRGVHLMPGAHVDFYGVDVPELSPDEIEFTRSHQAWPKDSVPVGRDRPALADDRPLGQRLSEALRRSIADSTAASYPRRSVLNAAEKAAWQLFYQAGATADAESGALDIAGRGETDPIATEALTRLRVELSLY